jgi:hypothetical protein
MGVTYQRIGTGINNKGDDMFKGDDDYAFRFVLVSRVAMGDGVNVK